MAAEHCFPVVISGVLRSIANVGEMYNAKLVDIFI